MSQSFYKSKKKSRLCDKTSGKCGEVTFCLQVGKRVYALNCLYCPQICIQWDAFINHMEEEHDEELSANHLLQQEPEESDVGCSSSKETKIRQSSDKLLDETPQSSQMCTDSEFNDSAEAYLDYDDDPLVAQDPESCQSSSITIKAERFEQVTDHSFENRMDNALKSDLPCDSMDDQLFSGCIERPTKKSWPEQICNRNNDEGNKRLFPEVSGEVVMSEINLNNIMDCFRGKTVINFYQRNNCLDLSNRRTLCDLIIDEVFNKGWRLRTKDLPQICEKIVEMFPSEDMFHYFVPREGTDKRVPTGFFYHRYYNRIKQIKDRPIIKRRRTKKNQVST